MLSQITSRLHHHHCKRLVLCSFFNQDFHFFCAPNHKESINANSKATNKHCISLVKLGLPSPEIKVSTQINFWDACLHQHTVHKTFFHASNPPQKSFQHIITHITSHAFLDTRSEAMPTNIVNIRSQISSNLFKWKSTKLKGDAAVLGTGINVSVYIGNHVI